MDELQKFCKFCHSMPEFRTWNAQVKTAFKNKELTIRMYPFRQQAQGMPARVEASLYEWCADSIDRMAQAYWGRFSIRFSPEELKQFTDNLCRSLGII